MAPVFRIAIFFRDFKTKTKKRSEMLASSGFVDKYSKFLEEKEKEAKENGFTEQDKPSVEDTLESTEALMKLKDQKKRADRYKRKFQQIEKDFL